MSRRLLGCASGLLLLVAAGSCVAHKLDIQTLPTGARQASRLIKGSVKAHLVDGGTVLFADSAAIDGGMVRGRGVRYDLALQPIGPVSQVPLDSVAALESFSSKVRPAETVLTTALAGVGVVALAGAIAVAANPKAFGSCPTAYSDSAGAAVLEAEGFSTSIAPVFEMPDVDRLRARPGPDGILRLEIRNEALETHFINYLALLAVEHAAGEIAVPDARGVPLAVRDLVPPARAVDRAGRNVLRQVAAHDGIYFASDSVTLWRATEDDFEDYIDLTFPATGDDSLAVLFRMRNSLLLTTILYELMLGDRGTQAFAWMTDRLRTFDGATAMGRWTNRSLGMKVAVDGGTGFVPVGRIGDSGPIAWRDVAFVVPVPRDRDGVIRLTFPADAWRIDRIAGGRLRRVTPGTVPLDRALDAAGSPVPAMVEALRVPDGRYVETSAGQRFTAEFRTGPAGPTTTWFVAWQGYYIEWMRRAWLTADRAQNPFVPGDAVLAEGLRRYRAGRDAAERLFYATRVPVR